MNSALLFGILAGLTQLYGYFIYNREIYRGEIKPNAVSWALWSIGSFIALWSYATLSDDWVKNILPATCAVVCVITFLYAIKKGKFEKPDKQSLIIAWIDVLVIVIWLLTRSPFYTNLFMQIDVVITFIPVLMEVWRKPYHEKPKPWIIWTGAYVLMTISIILSWEKWSDLMYPINYLILHSLVAVLILVRGKKGVEKLSNLSKI